LLPCGSGGVATRSRHDALPIYSLLMQEVHGMRILFPEDRDQHVGAGDFLLARGLDVQDRALNDALEAERGLGVDFLAAGDRGRVDRKSTRLNSSHVNISYAVFC